MTDFRQMYLIELQELCSMESQLTQALPKMADMAQNAQLKQGILDHVEETRSQRDRLHEILKRHGMATREHTDGSIQSIVREVDRWTSMVTNPYLRDAGMIASAQRVEHYEISAYGTMATWAKQLGLDDDLQVLLAILEEKMRTDQKLSELAKRTINLEASRA